jgi:hypothetical protein
MPRDALTVTTLTPNSGVLQPAAQTLTQANGQSIALPATAIPSSPDADSLILIVANTAAAPHNLIVRAGIGGGITPGPAQRAGLGDLTIAITNATTKVCGPFDPARFSQADGSILLDEDSGFTGNIQVFLMPTKWA